MKNTVLIRLDIQSEILVHLKAHLRVERALGKEVVPAMNKVKTSEKFLQAETCKLFAISSICGKYGCSFKWNSVQGTGLSEWQYVSNKRQTTEYFGLVTACF